MKKVLIAGSGYVGLALADLLYQDGCEVWCLRRNIEKCPPHVRSISADLTKIDTLENLPSGLDYVFFSAAASSSNEHAYHALYVQGLRNLLEVLAPQVKTIQRVLFTSSTTVYGQTDGSWIDESSLTTPTHATGLQMLEAEQILLQSDFRGTVLRFAGIYGPGRTHFVQKVRDGSPIPVGTYANLIHLRDCARVLQHLAYFKATQPLYIGVDHEPVLRTDLAQYIASLLKYPSPPVINASESAERRSNNKRCSNKLLLSTGYTFSYPTYREGYRDLTVSS